MRKSLQDLKRLWIPVTAAIAMGAVVHDYVPESLLNRLAGPETIWAVPAAAVLGIPVYASILVLLPLGSTMLAKGVGVGVVTAFLMGASGFSLPEGVMLAKILPAGLLAKILGVFTAGVIAIGFTFQVLSPVSPERAVIEAAASRGAYVVPATAPTVPATAVEPADRLAPTEGEGR
jgi:uncharacterized membrane protein YraQ (UPF0718 family)